MGERYARLDHLITERDEIIAAFAQEVSIACYAIVLVPTVYTSRRDQERTNKWAPFFLLRKEGRRGSETGQSARHTLAKDFDRQWFIVTKKRRGGGNLIV